MVPIPINFSKVVVLHFWLSVSEALSKVAFLFVRVEEYNTQAKGRKEPRSVLLIYVNGKVSVFLLVWNVNVL